MLKRALVILVLVFTITSLFADRRITRGPDIGEIYFIGPTRTSPQESIYHSTDFSETAVCVDSISNVMRICADKTSGGLYYNCYANLYYSNNYGNYGSWTFRGSDHVENMASGRIEGELFCGPYESSNDYGISFVQHPCNGIEESVYDFAIGNEDSIGYAIAYDVEIHSSKLYITEDNFENFEVHHLFDGNSGYIRRGSNNGEIFTIAGTPRLIKYSYDYGESWEVKNTLNYGGNYIDFVGGRQDGELYILSVYDYNLHYIAHIYIYHSTDYGKTFEVYHPFSKGEEPLVANFSSAILEGNPPLTVQFCNYSIGDIQSYEWDFDNDGVIDSYDEEPEYTYQDTGYYSVKLTVYDTDESDEFLRENYIHVRDQISIDEEVPFEPEIELKSYPNPITTKAEIYYSLPKNTREAVIEIYNIKGEQIEEIFISNNQSSIEWNTKSLASGIYFYKLNLINSPIKKMIMMR